MYGLILIKITYINTYNLHSKKLNNVSNLERRWACLVFYFLFFSNSCVAITLQQKLSYSNCMIKNNFSRSSFLSQVNQEEDEKRGLGWAVEKQWLTNKRRHVSFWVISLGIMFFSSVHLPINFIFLPESLHVAIKPGVTTETWKEKKGLWVASGEKEF